MWDQRVGVEADDKAVLGSFNKGGLAKFMNSRHLILFFLILRGMNDLILLMGSNRR